MLGRELNINRHTLYGIFAIVLWSTTVALARSLSEQVGSLTAATAVFLCSGVFCLGWIFYSRGYFEKIRQQSRWYLVGCGGLFVFYMLCLFLAIGLAHNRYQVLEIGLVNYLWPTLTILFSLLILHKKAKLSLVPATISALLGIFFVTTQGSSISWDSFVRHVGSNLIAYPLALMAAISWALYSNLARRWTEPESGGAVELFIPVTGIVLLLLRLLRPEDSLWTVQAVMEVLLMSLATTIAYILWDIAMRKGDVVLVASFSYFTPFLSTLVSCLYLRIMGDVKLWLGCILIVLGSTMSWASVSDRSHR